MTKEELYNQLLDLNNQIACVQQQIAKLEMEEKIEKSKSVGCFNCRYSAVICDEYHPRQCLQGLCFVGWCQYHRPDTEITSFIKDNIRNRMPLSVNEHFVTRGYITHYECDAIDELICISPTDRDLTEYDIDKCIKLLSVAFDLNNDETEEDND